MAGLPLKSGADFYNLEAARMRLHNLGADPTEVGAGLIYFNTSTGLNTSQKARLYTGSAWKTIAFSEDLDVAKNEDFLALQRKVDLLSGDVDTDDIISNMKEVSAFLKGFAEDASLMGLLNSKLDKTGGTIEGALTISSGTDKKIILNNTDTDNKYQFISFRQNGVEYGTLGTNASDDLVWGKEGAWKTILTTAGGTLTGNLTVPLLVFNSGLYLDTSGAKDLIVYDNTSRRVVLHSGNVGEYNAGSADVIAKTYVENINYNDKKSALKLIQTTGGGDSGVANGFPTNYCSGLSVMTDYMGWQMVSYGGDRANPWFRKLQDNGTWSDWKTIAFTDSDITGSVLNSDGDILLTYNDGLLLGYGSAVKSKNTIIYGNSVVMRYSSNRTQGFILNSSGNVTIGGSDLAGTSNKLWVDGNARVAGDFSLNPAQNVFLSFSISTSRGAIQALHDSVAYLPIALNPNGGNILIGTTTDNGSGAKLQVNGGIGTSSEVFLNHNKSIRMKGSNGTNYNVLFTSGTDLHIGYDSPAIRFGNAKMFINSSGNVGIRTTEPYCLLEVAASHKDINPINIAASANFAIGKHKDDGLFIGHDYTKRGSWIQSAYYGTEANPSNAHTYKLFLNPLGGNVLIGTTDDNGAKLNVGGRIEATGSITTKERFEVYGSQPYIDFHYGNSTEDYTTRLIEQTKGTLKLVGNIHVTGNIIADGEVSAGGRAEEGDNAGGGGAAEKVTATIEVGLKFKEISHTLGDNVIVQVYEWNANGQTWDMVLTDVETTTNLVTVRFGNETDVPHKVVII